MRLHTVNPALGTPLADYPQDTDADLADKLAAASRAHREWRRLAIADRAPALRVAARRLRAGQVEVARLMAAEMGKPLNQGLAEVEKCAQTCEYFAEHAAGLLAPEEVPTEARRSFVAFEPLGPLLAVMPWNFPLWQVFRCAAPALMAGNAVLLKHASNVTGCAQAIGAMLAACELPAGLFGVLLADSTRLAPLVAHPDVRAVTLTGSVPAGRAIAALAGAALKKTVLELGGSDPYLVLADADLEQAARVCAQARLINSGQSCIAAKRFIIVELVRREFEERLVAELVRAPVGDPGFATTVIGPLARADLRDELHRQVTRSVEAGATCLLGGHLPTGPGFYYPATVLSDVQPGMAVFDEETFGPVAAIVSARDEAEAVALANRSSFGLGAAVFTRDVEKGERLAREELEAGVCFVNTQVRSDPRLPFGGLKDSGYGRELGRLGIREFVNAKTVYVA